VDIIHGNLSLFHITKRPFSFASIEGCGKGAWTSSMKKYAPSIGDLQEMGGKLNLIVNEWVQQKRGCMILKT
jgi:hypothetical protein